MLRSIILLKILHCLLVASWLAFKTFLSILHSTNSTMLQITLNNTFQTCLTLCFQVHSNYSSRCTSKYILLDTSDQAFMDAPNLTWSYTLSHMYSLVASQDSLKDTLKHAHKYVTNCTVWYSSSILGSMLRSLLSTDKTLPISPVYTFPCMLVVMWSADLQICSHQASKGRWWAVGTAWHITSEIIQLVNIKVQTLSLLCPPQWDQTILSSHGTDNHDFRFCRAGRKLALRLRFS
jgi:hypothetical protein